MKLCCCECGVISPDLPLDSIYTKDLIVLGWARAKGNSNGRKFDVAWCPIHAKDHKKMAFRLAIEAEKQ
jgi:hypothetical protein